LLVFFCATFNHTVPKIACGGVSRPAGADWLEAGVVVQMMSSSSLSSDFLCVGVSAPLL
jgi:hypothetical protein